MWAKHTKLKHLNGASAFTIVELLIVIVVIAILAAITIVAFNGVQDRARSSAAASSATQAAKKVKTWQVDNEATSPTCPKFYELITGTTTDAPGIPTPPAICTFTYKDTDYQYMPNSTSTVAGSYCVTTTVVTRSYKVSESSLAQPGGCNGHGQGGVQPITNLALNPSLETNTTGWNANWGTSATGNAVRMSDGGWNGNAYFRMTWTTSATVSWGGVNLSNIAATEGQSFTASIWVRSSSAQTLRLYLRPNTYPTGADTAGNAVNVPVNTWTRLSVTLASSPAGITSYTPFTSRSSTGTWVAGDIFDSDGLMITQGTTLHNYADGASQNWSWSNPNTPNNSTSTGPPQ